jgi:hypothetical protein
MCSSCFIPRVWIYCTAGGDWWAKGSKCIFCTVWLPCQCVYSTVEGVRKTALHWVYIWLWCSTTGLFDLIQKLCHFWSKHVLLVRTKSIHHLSVTVYWEYIVLSWTNHVVSNLPWLASGCLGCFHCWSKTQEFKESTIYLTHGLLQLYLSASLAVPQVVWGWPILLLLLHV